MQFLYSKKEGPVKAKLESCFKDMEALYSGFETVESVTQAEFLYLQQIVKKSYEFCKTQEVQIYARRLEDSVNDRPTKQVGSAIKCLRQIEKIAAYWRISLSLVDAATTYAELFKPDIKIEYVAPYLDVPTTISYESWAKTCHVHAEVQLAIHYDAVTFFNEDDVPSTVVVSEGHSAYMRPRAIGTSKYLCYLCYQFLRAHGYFFPANTHGRLYDQWTIPDLKEFDALCVASSQRCRRIVKEIDEEVVKQIAATAPDEGGNSLVRLRAEPMTSRQNLLDIGDEVVGSSY